MSASTKSFLFGMVAGVVAYRVYVQMSGKMG